MKPLRCPLPFLFTLVWLSTSGRSLQHDSSSLRSLLVVLAEEQQQHDDEYMMPAHVEVGELCEDHSISSSSTRAVEIPLPFEPGVLPGWNDLPLPPPGSPPPHHGEDHSPPSHDHPPSPPRDKPPCRYSDDTTYTDDFEVDHMGGCGDGGDDAYARYLPRYSKDSAFLRYTFLVPLPHKKQAVARQIGTMLRDALKFMWRELGLDTDEERMTVMLTHSTPIVVGKTIIQDNVVKWWRYRYQFQCVWVNSTDTANATAAQTGVPGETVPFENWEKLGNDKMQTIRTTLCERRQDVRRCIVCLLYQYMSLRPAEVAFLPPVLVNLGAPPNATQLAELVRQEDLLAIRERDDENKYLQNCSGVTESPTHAPTVAYFGSEPDSTAADDFAGPESVTTVGPNRPNDALPSVSYERDDWDTRRKVGLALFLLTAVAAPLLSQIAAYRTRRREAKELWGNLATEEGVTELLRMGWRVSGTQMEVFDKKGMGYDDGDSMLMGGYEQRLMGGETTLPETESLSQTNSGSNPYQMPRRDQMYQEQLEVQRHLPPRPVDSDSSFQKEDADEVEVIEVYTSTPNTPPEARFPTSRLSI